MKAEYTNWFDEVKDVKAELSIPIDKNRNFMELPTYEASFSDNIKYKEGHRWGTRLVGELDKPNRQYLVGS